MAFDLTKMNRTERRDFIRDQHAYVDKLPRELVPVPAEKIDSLPELRSAKPTAAFWSRFFLVLIFNHEGYIRLSIMRSHMRPNGFWDDNINWEELQRLKNDAGFKDYDLVEVFPRDKDVINVQNMRHLWVIPDGLPFIWRK